MYIPFQDSLIANLLRLINRMKPKPQDQEVKPSENTENTSTDDKELQKKLFPGLAIPNDPNVRVS